MVVRFFFEKKSKILAGCENTIVVFYVKMASRDITSDGLFLLNLLFKNNFHEIYFIFLCAGLKIEFLANFFLCLSICDVQAGPLSVF